MRSPATRQRQSPVRSDHAPRRPGGRLGRTGFWAVLLTVLLVVSVLYAVTFGPADITAQDAWASIVHHLGLGGSGTGDLTPLRDGIVWQLRFPRVLTAAAVGAGLALSGAIMQAVTRNPLADPYLLGLSSGASLGAVAVILLGATLFVSAAAFLGAVLALLITLVLAGAAGPITPTRTVLAGLAVSSLFAAATSLVIFWTAAGDSYREILSWLLGSLSGADWPAVAIAVGAVLIVGLPLMASARTLDSFAFGDTAAAALGVNVPAARWVILAATALLTGAMVSVSGSIGFVGLILPHAVRLLTGPRHRSLLPLSALAGAVFLIWTDTAARTLFEPRELPVGIITALVGAPVFAIVMMRRKKMS